MRRNGAYADDDFEKQVKQYEHEVTSAAQVGGLQTKHIFVLLSTVALCVFAAAIFTAFQRPTSAVAGADAQMSVEDKAQLDTFYKEHGLTPDHDAHTGAPDAAHPGGTDGGATLVGVDAHLALPTDDPAQLAHQHPDPLLHDEHDKHMPTDAHHAEHRDDAHYAADHHDDMHHAADHHLDEHDKHLPADGHHDDAHHDEVLPENLHLVTNISQVVHDDHTDHHAGDHHFDHHDDLHGHVDHADGMHHDDMHHLDDMHHASGDHFNDTHHDQHVDGGAHYDDHHMGQHPDDAHHLDDMHHAAGSDRFNDTHHDQHLDIGARHDDHHMGQHPDDMHHDAAHGELHGHPDDHHLDDLHGHHDAHADLHTNDHAWGLDKDAAHGAASAADGHATAATTTTAPSSAHVSSESQHSELGIHIDPLPSATAMPSATVEQSGASLTQAAATAAATAAPALPDIPGLPPAAPLVI